MEELIKLQPYKVKKRCDKCKYFNVEFSGIMLPVSPPKYQHKCSNDQCDNIEYYNVKYPYIKYEEVFED